MAIDYGAEASELLFLFVGYHRSVKQHSEKTIEGYYVDVRQFFRYFKQTHGLVERDVPFDQIPVYDVDVPMIESVTKADIYSYEAWLTAKLMKERDERIARKQEKERQLQEKLREKLGPLYEEKPITNTTKDKDNNFGNTIKRKLSSLCSFYQVMTVKYERTKHDPTLHLDRPKAKKDLPKFLQENETYRLLSAINGAHAARDRCIIVILLTCALRVSELCNLDLGDIQEDSLRITGKGNKVRYVYLNKSAKMAIDQWLEVRDSYFTDGSPRIPALFLSQKHTRISVDAVERMLQKTCNNARLDTAYTPHKLRHTSATLMLKNGIDIRVISEVLGHAQLSATQIYTHVINSDQAVAAQVLDKYMDT